MFALGIVYWMFNRPMEQTENFLKEILKRPEVVEGNIKVIMLDIILDTIEALSSSYTVLSADLEKEPIEMWWGTNNAWVF